MVADQADDRRLARAPAVLWRTTMRGVLVSVPDHDEPVLCTSPGDLVWELLAEPTAPSELAVLLAEHFDADEERIATDLAPVLQELLDLGALVVVDPDPN